MEERERLKSIEELKTSQRRTLMAYKKSGVAKNVEIWAAMDERTCNACREWNGKRISLDRAMQGDILPIKDCTSDWCRCTYAPVLKV
ncbi:MAG: hypothetical protein NWF14_06350 [Candidatus Bathyarchaeota archaeon]|jgi:hypothetical protein|nr:hypothetical protein [Candidatus Bathyarchaeota archaeon]